MLDQWANLVMMGKSSDFLIVAAFVTKQNINTLGIALDQRRGDLAIVFFVLSSHGDRELHSFPY